MVAAHRYWPTILAIPFGNDEACRAGPLEQFGRYLGNWDIEDSQLGQDGETWSPGEDARWNFACLGNGTAVQDPLQRFTFFPPDDNGWDWTPEFSTNGGESWFEVYRIKATRSD